MDTLDPKFLDKRTVGRYLRDGSLEDKALDKYLKSLPDVTEKASPIDTLMDSDGDDVESDAAES